MTPPRGVRIVLLIALLSPFAACRAALAQQAGPGELYEKCAPSVVMVTAVETVPCGVVNRTADLFSVFPVTEIPLNVVRFVVYPFRVILAGPLKVGGSGVIISEDGHFLTNNHVVERRDLFWATLHDGHVVRADLVGADEEEDYALLKLRLKQGETVRAATLGDSAALRPGDAVFAIGSPLRLRQTLSTGVVAGVERRLGGPFQDYIQTDLTVGAGSSGGPLFDADGRVVGITTLMFAVIERTGGVTFSIPINNVKEGLDQLKKETCVTRGLIGARLDDVTPRRREQFGLQVEKGACVVQVDSSFLFDTPARDAGLRPGDVIVRYGDVAVERARPLARAVLNTRPGTKVAVEFYRGKELLRRTVEVGER